MFFDNFLRLSSELQVIAKISETQHAAMFRYNITMTIDVISVYIET